MDLGSLGGGGGRLLNGSGDVLGGFWGVSVEFRGVKVASDTLRGLGVGRRGGRGRNGSGGVPGVFQETPDGLGVSQVSQNRSRSVLRGS